MTHDRSRLASGYAIALISAALLSTTAIFISYLLRTHDLPPLVLAFWRDAFVFITLLLILKAVRPVLLRLNKPNLFYLATYGLLLAVFNSVWTFSVMWNGAAVSTVLVYCSAAFTAILGWWLLKETLDWVKVLAIALSLGGCVLVSDSLDPAAWGVNVLGILTGILSGLCYAIYSLMGRAASQRGLNPWTTVLYTFGFAALFLLFLSLIPSRVLPGTASNPAGLFTLGNVWSGWGLLVMLAAGPTLLGYGLYTTSLSYLPSSVANLIMTLEPALTAVTAYVVLGEKMSGLEIVGGLTILGGVVFLRVHEGLSMESTRSQVRKNAGIVT